MLDAETKRKIDNCRDILVGKIPDPKSQVEQITIALIYKFMDDMDQEAIYMGGKPSFFTGEFEKYSWSSIFDPHISGFELLNLYGEALVKMNHNPNIPPLFRDIFKNAFLPYRDPETLRLFLKEIRVFTYDHSERLGDAFEYLLSVLSSQGEAGQFRTPRHIIDFIVKIIDPQLNHTILDPACGTAGFLISAYKHILKNNPKLSITQKKRLMNNFVGYDISADMVRLSLVNMYLHGFPDPHIHEYDTLTYEDRWNDTFDVIMANPPFMSPKGGIRPHSRFSIKAKRSEVLFVDYIGEHLNPGGRAGVIVPEGIIFQYQKAYKALRKILVENYLWAVVSLPAGVFNPYSGVKTSILLMDKSLAKRIHKILFVKIENDGFDLGAQRRPIDKNDLPAALKFLNIYKSKIETYKSAPLSPQTSPGGPLAHAVPKSEIAKSADYNLSGDRYHVASECSTEWPLCKLEDVCDIESGSRQKGGAVDSGVPSIGGEQISENGTIKHEKMKYITEAHFSDMKKGVLSKGDVLIVKDGATTGKTAFFDSDIRAAVNEHVFILRAKENILAKLLYGLIKSQYFQEKLQRYIKGIIGGISLEIKEIQIPLPPLDVQEKIVAEIDGYQKIIDGARQVVDNYKPTIKIDPDWPIVELASVCDFKRGPFGGSLKKEIFVKSGYKVYEQKHAIQNNFEIGNYYISSDKYKEMKNFSLNAGDLIISCSGTMGKIAIVPNQFAPGIINQALLKLTPKPDKVLPLFLKTALESDTIQSSFFQNQLGVAIQNVASVKILKKIKLPLPPLDKQKQIVAQIEAEQKIVNSNKILIEIYHQKIKDKIAEVWGFATSQAAVRATTPYKDDAAVVCLLLAEMEKLQRPTTEFFIQKHIFVTKHHLHLPVNSVFKRKVAGPWSQELRWKAIEAAIKMNWLRCEKKRFVAGSAFEKALNHAATVLGEGTAQIAQLVEDLKTFGQKGLERWTTVLKVVEDLKETQQPITRSNIQHEIDNWRDKRLKEIFAEESVDYTIKMMLKHNWLPTSAGQ